MLKHKNKSIQSVFYILWKLFFPISGVLENIWFRCFAVFHASQVWDTCCALLSLWFFIFFVPVSGESYDRRRSPIHYSRSPRYARTYSRSPEYYSSYPRRRRYSRFISSLVSIFIENFSNVLDSVKKNLNAFYYCAGRFRLGTGGTGRGLTRGHLMCQGAAAVALVGAAVEARITLGDWLIELSVFNQK